MFFFLEKYFINVRSLPTWANFRVVLFVPVWRFLVTFALGNSKYTHFGSHGALLARMADIEQPELTFCIYRLQKKNRSWSKTPKKSKSTSGVGRFSIQRHGGVSNCPWRPWKQAVDNWKSDGYCSNHIEDEEIVVQPYRGCWEKLVVVHRPQYRNRNGLTDEVGPEVAKSRISYDAIKFQVQLHQAGNLNYDSATRLRKGRWGSS